MVKHSSQGAVLLLILPIIVIITLLLTSAISLLSTQHQIRINNQVNLMAKMDCRNALQISRLWLRENADMPPTPTFDASHNVWLSTANKPSIDSEQWWQDSIRALGGQSLTLMPQIGAVGMRIDHLAGEASEPFRDYQISVRCQNNQSAMVATMTAQISIIYPTQTPLPTMNVLFDEE